MEVAKMRRLSSLPRVDSVFQEELAYGIRMTLLEDYVEYAVMVTRHPEEERFLMLVSLLNRQYWIIDLKSIEIEEEHHELQRLYELKKGRYIIFLESGRWIFTFATEAERTERLAQFINLQKLAKLKKGADDQLDSRFLKLFLRFDLNDDQFIDDQELQQVLKSFDISFDEIVKQCIKEISPASRKGLRKTEFHTLMKVLLCKQELIPLFRKYCPGAAKEEVQGILKKCMEPLMEQSDFQMFLKEEQGLEPNEIADHVRQAGLVNKKISFNSFCKFVFSQTNSIIDRKKHGCYQDMDRPLTEYYVHSSHNTYLVGNQLTSDSKAFRYIEDFYDGVRCVELDIHNGPDGPIIKHGFTLTAPVSFRDVIQAVAEFSNDNQGHLPLIMSFENHCSLDNQRAMANILKQLLGDKIYLIPQSCSNTHRFPSPNTLRNKIIIQGTGHMDQIRPNTLRSKIELTASRYQRNESLRVLQSLSPNYPTQFLRSKDRFTKRIQTEIQQKNQKTKALDTSIMKGRESLQVAADTQLLQYYSIFVSKLELEQTCWEMGNISEANLLNHIEDGRRMDSLIQFTRKCHVRVYPQGTRFGSSNFNPIPMYEAGAQLVSLNTQSNDIFNMVMNGNFLENGWKKGGYLLKPAHLRSESPYVRECYQLTIQPVSVHNISNNQDENCQVQIKMCLVCSRSDQASNHTNCTLTELTELKPQVHYQARFQRPKPFSCKLRDIDFAHVYIQIPFCGHISIPVRMMRTGYRVIPLLDRLKQFRPNLYVLAHIKLKKVTS